MFLPPLLAPLLLGSIAIALPLHTDVTTATSSTNFSTSLPPSNSTAPYKLEPRDASPPEPFDPNKHPTMWHHIIPDRNTSFQYPYIPPVKCPEDHRQFFWIGNDTMVKLDCGRWQVECGEYATVDTTGDETCTRKLAIRETKDFHTCLAECALADECNYVSWIPNPHRWERPSGRCDMRGKLIPARRLFSGGYSAFVAKRPIHTPFESGSEDPWHNGEWQPPDRDWIDYGGNSENPYDKDLGWWSNVLDWLP